MKARHVLWAALGGAAGGLLNAALCYLKWPAAVPGADFKWHVMPAGCLHGAVLAALALAAGLAGRRIRAVWRWTPALPVAWLAAYASWIPLHVSAFEEPWSRALVWPFRADYWAPIAQFGGVALLAYLWSTYASPNARARSHAVALSIAGVVGSLWFWIEFDRWYFSGLHGVAWGCLTSLGLLWAAERESRVRS